MAKYYRRVRVHKKDGYLDGLPGTLPRKQTTKEIVRASVSEDHIQAAVERYLGLKHVFYIHIPNTLWCWISTKAPPWIKKIAGAALAGLPDIIAFDGKGLGLRCLPLELKTEAGTMNPRQREIKNQIGTLTARSVDEAVEIIDTWLKIGQISTQDSQDLLSDTGATD